MNAAYLAALTESRAVAATARKAEQIADDLFVYEFASRPLLFVCASEHATRDEIARHVLGQFAIAGKQRRVASELEALHSAESEDFQ